MDDEQLKRHVLAKRLLRRCKSILRGIAQEENLTPRHKATDLVDDIDLFFESEPVSLQEDRWLKSRENEDDPRMVHGGPPMTLRQVMESEDIAERCHHCGVLPGETHGITCPHLPKGMFGSLTPEISTGMTDRMEPGEELENWGPGHKTEGGPMTPTPMFVMLTWPSGAKQVMTVEDLSANLRDMIAHEDDEGEEWTIQHKKMTQEEYDNLPEFSGP
jgi:hypothetical protein